MRGNQEKAVEIMGLQNFRMAESLSFHERRLLRMQQSTQAFGKAQEINQPQAHPNSSIVDEDDTEPMALSTMIRD